MRAAGGSILFEPTITIVDEHAHWYELVYTNCRNLACTSIFNNDYTVSRARSGWCYDGTGCISQGKRFAII